MPIENWHDEMKACYKQLLEKDSFLIFFRYALVNNFNDV
jgi:hypothetical protein